MASSKRSMSPSARSDAGSVASSSVSNKKNLNDLTKEELVQKCKNLLMLAQKAKAAKDEATKQLQKVRSRAEEANTLQEMVATLNAQKVQTAEEIRKLHENDTKLKNRIEDLDQNNNRLECQCLSLESQISVLQKENQTIQANCDEMESNLQTAKANMTAEKEKVKKSEGSKMELQAKVICLTSEKDRISELLRLKSEECDGAKKDAHLKGGQVDSLTKEKTNLEASHAQQKQQVEQLQATLSSAISKESHEKLQQELDAALTNLQLKKDECEKLTMDQTKEKIAQDEEEAKEVQRLNDALKTQNTLIDKLRENLNDNEKEKRNLDQALSQLRSESDQVQSKSHQQIEEMKSKNNNLSSQLKRANGELSEKTAKVAELGGELESVREQLVTANEKANDVSADLEEKTKLVETLKIDKSEVQADHDRASKELVDLQNEFDAAKAKLEGVNCELSDKTAKVAELGDELESVREQLLTANEKANGVSADLEEKTKLVEKFKTEKSEVQADLDRASKELLDLRNEFVATKTELEAQITENEQTVQKLTGCIENLEAELNEKGSQKPESHHVNEEKKAAEERAEKAEKSLEDSLVALEKKTRETEELWSLCNTNDEKMVKMGETISQLTNEVASYEESLEQSEARNDELSKKIEDLEHQMGILVEKRDTISFELCEKETEMNSKVESLEAKSADLSQVVSSTLLDLDIEGMDVTVEGDIDSVSAAIREKIRALNSEKVKNSELLAEMNSMNVELKSRGERISVFESDNATLTREVEDMKEKIEAQTSTLSMQSTKIQSLQLKLETSQQPVKEASPAAAATGASDNSKNVSMDENMSTSTVSKAEEETRMQDVETSFEDRYTKLKLVAVKLKKKTVDQEKRISQLTSELGEASSTGGGQKTKASQLLKNLSNLQAEYDTLQDKVEEQNGKIKALEQDLAKSLQDYVQTKETLDTIQSELKSKSSALSTSEASLEKATEQILDGRKLAEDNSDQNLMTVKLEVLRPIEEEKNTLEKTVDELRSRLDKLSDNEKRQDQLELELEEAETKVKDMTEGKVSLEEKLAAAIVEKTRELEAKENKNAQITELESLLDTESKRAVEFKSKLEASRKEVSDLNVQLSTSMAQVSDLSKDLEQTRAAKEKLTMELAEVSGNAVSESQSASARADSLTKMVAALEAEVTRRKSQAGEAETRLSQVEAEFKSYKVRAQNVLKAQTNTPNNSEAKQSQKSQELASLERVVQGLNQKVSDMGTKLSASQLEFSHLNQDHERLMTRHSALLQEAAGKEKAARDKHDQLLKLANQAEKARQDALAKGREDMDALKQAYESKLETIGIQNSIEVDKMQRRMDELENQLIRMQSIKERSSGEIGGVGSAEMLKREAAEGSESADLLARPPSTSADDKAIVTRQSSLSPPATVHGSRQPPGQVASRSSASATPSPVPPNDIVPLDKLLFSPESEDKAPTMEISKSEYEALLDRFTSAEKRVSHLNSLLSEAETESQRMSQLAEVLKEEIRTYQRSEERSKHIENLEYVKNVIIKFLTLPGSSEKTSLVPVLSTILRLSPSEVQTVQRSIEAAEASNTVAQNADEAGWSSYMGFFG